jgi:dTDP-4-amino-4,6-dideoxy-D-galactose acyltransferase
MTARTDDALRDGELLAWDTEHFGFRVGQVRERRPNAARLRDAVTRADSASIACLYLLVDGWDDEVHRLAQRHGFRFVDIRLTLAQSVSVDGPIGAGADLTVRAPQSDDATKLASIATHGYWDSRFYADGRFEAAAVSRLYERWLVGSFDGSLADRVFIAEAGGEPVGYLTSKLDHVQRQGSIGLVGVSPGKRGEGIARALLASALREFAVRGMTTAAVVTQGRNVAAQRLYQASGFRTERVELWFHRWADEQSRTSA